MNELKTFKLNLDKLPIVLKSRVCLCGGKYFIVVYEIKDIPKFISPTGEQGILLIQHYKCDNCGKILDDEVTN